MNENRKDYKMKLDRLKFAKLVAHCCSNGFSVGDWEIERMDDLIEFEVPEAPKANCADVDDLLDQMLKGEKIPAIKAYRTLTGAGLKESKDAVEKYWVSKGHYSPTNEPATLGDILGHAKKG